MAVMTASCVRMNKVVTGLYGWRLDGVLMKLRIIRIVMMIPVMAVFFGMVPSPSPAQPPAQQQQQQQEQQQVPPVGVLAEMAEEDYPPIIWPDPTPEELVNLPYDGCKHFYAIDAPDAGSIEYLGWRYSDDGICWEWYGRHVERAFILGQTPPPGTDPELLRYYTGEEDRKEKMRKYVESLYMPVAPRGSNPTLYSPRLNPVYNYR